MTAIEFENISKQYRLGLVSTRTLSHDLNRWWRTRVLRQEDPYLKIGSVNDRETKADSDYVWALKDISLKIEQGEVVGIIGRNGAGKSTLLKLLSRVTNPTTGVIRARGRVASLLEVGTGFHPELTGRENIYMNGAIMGMSKREITRKLDEIVDFSGCERYIDTPVKRYSSGMTVRLGFAVAAHLDPDILVVDEVLAVGDAGFQKKAIGKMQDVSREEGRTVLFVSHNMASMINLCERGVLLDRGCVIYTGGIMDTVAMYTQGADTGKIHYNNSPGEGRGGFRFRSARVRCNGQETFDVIDVFDRISLRVDYELTRDDAYKSIAVFIEKDGMVIATLMDTTHRPDLLRERRKGFYSMDFDLPCPLLKPGRYTATVKYTRPRIDDFVVWRDCLRFEVGLSCSGGTDSGYAGNYAGMVAIDPALRIERVER